MFLYVKIGYFGVKKHTMLEQIAARADKINAVNTKTYG
jgi:hypothetical protein